MSDHRDELHTARSSSRFSVCEDNVDVQERDILGMHCDWLIKALSDVSQWVYKLAHNILSINKRPQLIMCVKKMSLI